MNQALQVGDDNFNRSIPDLKFRVWQHPQNYDSVLKKESKIHTYAEERTRIEK